MSAIFLGFLIGLRHALEADHIAAVAALASRTSTAREAVRVGLAWGLGHTITLLLVGTVVVVLDAAVPIQFAHYLEFAVGVMLVALGADVVRRVIRDRIHFHVHGHDSGVVHFHAHTHVDTRGPHKEDAHQHVHPPGFPYRALLVGLMHGMAGSAALILLTLSSVDSIALAIGYMALFGLGSLLGMAALSLAIALPLRATARNLTWAHNSLQCALGITSVALGALLIHTTLNSMA